MSKLRILCVEPLGLFPSHFEGLATRISTGLTDLGHEVTLLTYAGLRSNPSPKTLPFKLLTVRGSASKKGFVAALPGDRGYFARRLAPFWITFRSAFRLVAKENFDCVYFLDWHPVLLLLAFRIFGARSRKHTRFVGLLHTPDKLRKRKTGFEERYRRFFVSSLRRLTLEYLDNLVVLHESLKEELIFGLKLGKKESDRIQVIPHGMDFVSRRPTRVEARSRLGWPVNETVFLLLGTLRWEKRPDVAIKAIAELPECRLAIAGLPGYWNGSKLHALAAEACCEDAINFHLDFVDDAQVGDFFAAADAVLVPYARAFKGASGILAHACAHGRSVIASSIPAFESDIRKQQIGLLFEPEQPESLRDAIVRFCLMGKEERRAMETRAEGWARRNSWESHCEKLDELMTGRTAERALAS